MEGLTLTGSDADLDPLIDELLALRKSGVDEVSLRLYGEPEHSLRLVAERVVPALR